MDKVMNLKFEVNKDVNEDIIVQQGVIKVALWTIALIFLAQIVLATFASFYFSMQQSDSYTQEAFEQWFTSLPVLLTIMFISPIITLPLLMKATPKIAGVGKVAFWKLEKTNKKVLVKWLMVALSFWAVFSFVGFQLDIPVEPLMLEMKAALNNVPLLLLGIITVCFVAPVMEELIFRGWLFSQIQQTQFGSIGALIITSFVFTAIHSQYQHIFTFIALLLLGGLLGFIRYKSNNTSYAVIVHVLFNILSLITLFLFD
jgi:membrane protease YdiL (CAAX protease family)